MERQVDWLPCLVLCSCRLWWRCGPSCGPKIPIISSWFLWQRAGPSMAQWARLRVLASNLVFSTWSLSHSRTCSAVQQWGLIWLYHWAGEGEPGVTVCSSHYVLMACWGCSSVRLWVEQLWIIYFNLKPYVGSKFRFRFNPFTFVSFKLNNVLKTQPC